MKYWTKQEIDILQKHYSNSRYHEVSELLPNRTKDAIRQKANQLGLRKEREGNGFQLNENIFKNWSIESAYLFGYLTADGCLKHHNKQNGYFIQLTAKAPDKEHLVKVKNLLQFEGNIHEQQSGYDKKVYNLVIGSKKIYNDLITLGLTPRKTYSLVFPHTLPEELYPLYFRGFNDGDGCISYHKCPNYYILQCKLGSATESYINKIKSIICNQINIKEPKTTKRKNLNFWEFGLYGPKAKKYLDWIYDYPLFIKLERKYYRYLLSDKNGRTTTKPKLFR